MIRAFHRAPAPWVTIAIAALAAGCTRTPVLRATGDQAAAIENVWWLMVWICGTVYAAVMVALAYALWRRRRSAREGTSHDGRLNIVLVAWGVLTVGLLTWLIAASFVADRRIRTGRPDLEVLVTAKQWWWQVDYLDRDPSRQVTTANELVLPRDRIARVTLKSGDVIHSFWVPSLSGKHDLVPGTTNAILVTPRANGDFRGQCAEFCGLQHAHMSLDVRVVDPDDFEGWRNAQILPAASPRGASAQRGAALFQRSTCAMCHRVQGTLAGSLEGPDLTHFASRRSIGAGTLPLTRAQLAAWLADPQHPKPGVRMPAVPLTPQQRADLVDYLMELK